MNVAEVDGPFRQTAGTWPFCPKYQHYWKCHAGVKAFDGSTVGSRVFSSWQAASGCVWFHHQTSKRVFCLKIGFNVFIISPVFV